MTRIAEPSDSIVFVSHRWWGDNHPDIDGIKYGIVCRGLLALAKERRYDPETMVVWLDFACIDQDDEDRMAGGIASLISYASRCSAMLVPVYPDAEAISAFRAATHPSQLINYGERAWCRLENYVATCIAEIRGEGLPLFGYGITRRYHGEVHEQIRRSGKRRPLGCLPPISCEALISLGGDDESLGAVFSKFNLPHAGALTVEDDRHVVRAVEDDIRAVYVAFAIKAECRRMVCTAQQLLDEWEAKTKTSGRTGSSKVRAGITRMLSSKKRFFAKRMEKDKGKTKGGGTFVTASGLIAMNLNGKQLHDENVAQIGTVLEEVCKKEANHPDIIYFGDDFSSCTIQPFVGIVRLSNNLLTQTGIPQLFEGVLSKSWCQNLETLDLSGNIYLGDSGLEALLSALVGSERIGSVSGQFTGSHIGTMSSATAPSSGGTMESTTVLSHLRSLFLANVGTSDKGGIRLLKWLQVEVHFLEAVDFRGNAVTNAFGEELLSVFASLGKAKNGPKENLPHFHFDYGGMTVDLAEKLDQLSYIARLEHGIDVIGSS